MSLSGNGRKRVVRHRLALACGLGIALGVVLAQPAGAQSGGAQLARDSVLAALLHDALGSRPELTQAQATVQADQARVPQARALPDPVVSLGIQNDGFKRIQIGTMETSFWSLSAAQTFPWAGKRALRATAQSLGAKQSQTDYDRARLFVQAEVERAYVDLLLVRDRIAILGRLEVLWVQAEGLARSRYESGAAAQSDVLRAQLERSRLQQQRAALTAEERQRVAVLNRSVGRPMDRAVPTALSLGDLSDPALPDSTSAEADVESRSPELNRARLAVQQSGTLVAIARRDYYPDLTLSGGVMPRGGIFEPMWQAGVSLPIPLWAGSKQSQAVTEYRLRGQAAESSAETTRRLVRQRLEERRAMLTALLETNRLYRAGVLIQSGATVSSAMAQYQVGKVPFASVLESLSGYLTDLAGFYESVAAAQRIDIAQHELSLDPVPGPTSGGAGSASMSGSAGMGGASTRTGSTPPAASAGSPSSAMPKM